MSSFDYDTEEYDDEEYRDGYTGHLYMRLIKLYEGGLYLRVSSYCATMTIQFDDALNDGVPYLVHMFNRLKERRPYAFTDEYESQTFAIGDFKDDTVLLTVKSGNYQDEEEGCFTFRERLPVGYVLHQLDTLFNDILHNENFPWQYPCFSYMDGVQSDRAYKLADKEIEEKHVTDDDEWESIECKYHRELVTKFDAGGEELCHQFKEMLIKREVPKGWHYDDEIQL